MDRTTQRKLSRKVLNKIRTTYKDVVLVGRMIVEPPSGSVQPDTYRKLLDLRERLVEVLGISPTNTMQQRMVRDSLTSAAMDKSNVFQVYADRLISNLQV